MDLENTLAEDTPRYTAEEETLVKQYTGVLKKERDPPFLFWVR